MSKANVRADGVGWVYSDIVKEHFLHPKNFLGSTQDKVDESQFDGIGEVGSPACGDLMWVYIKVDNVSGRIKDLKWQTFGCASAIASTSVMSEMVLENGGMMIDEAQEITAMDIAKRLGGLPDKKIHCSVLGDQALKSAIADFKEQKLKSKEKMHKDKSKNLL